MRLKKNKKKTGFSIQSVEEAYEVLEQFFVGDNCLHAKSIFYEWYDFGLSAEGSLKVVFSEML